MNISIEQLKDLLSVTVNAALEAGSEIMGVYTSDNFFVESKEDKSPLTIADKKANDVIVFYLSKTGIPIISEEIKNHAYEIRKDWKFAWIVDPLDGTKEFIKRNDEFTVNIALVENGTPILGVVYTPVLDELYFSVVELGAFKLGNASVSLDNFEYESMVNKANKLPMTFTNRKFTVVGSKSHMTPETQEYIDTLKQSNPDIDFISKGSSLKICMVAEGKADEYPRFAPTSEWDTAAGHAIVLGAGMKMINYKTGNPVIYNKEDILNPWFLVKK